MSNIVVPELGESVVEARVARWLKKEGDRVELGEPVVELETEKIDLEVNADRSGVIASIKRQEGEDVKIGELLAVLEEGAATASAAAGGNGSGTQAAPAADAPRAAAPAAEDPRSTPTARSMAKAHDVNLGAVQGSGSGGRIMKQDVQAALGGTRHRPATPHRHPQETRLRHRHGMPRRRRLPGSPLARRAIAVKTRQRMSKRRATIARRLVEAQRTAAMLTTFNEVDMTAVMALRARRKEAFQKQHGVGLGIASFFVKASVAALRAFPPLNAEIQGDEIVLKHYYDIGMAVGAEGGLVVPVIRDADRLSFAEIELAIRDFAERAQNGTLTLEDLRGRHVHDHQRRRVRIADEHADPESAAGRHPRPAQDPGARRSAIAGKVDVRPMMYIALSYDHRIVDGREAVQFLVKIKEYIEDPGQLLIES